MSRKIGDLVRVKRTDGRITPGCLVSPSSHDWWYVVVGPGRDEHGKTMEDCVNWIQAHAAELDFNIIKYPFPMRRKLVAPEHLLPYAETHWLVPDVYGVATACGIPATADVHVTTALRNPKLTCVKCRSIHEC